MDFPEQCGPQIMCPLGMLGADEIPASEPLCHHLQTEQETRAQMQYKDVIPDSKVHGASMGPIWGRQDPGGPHVGPMNFAIWDLTSIKNPIVEIRRS